VTVHAAGFASLLPPLIAIGLAIYSRRVYLSLAAGIWLGWTIVAAWNPLAGLAKAIDACIAVLGVADNARVLVFTLLIGSLVGVVEANGGVRGFVRWAEGRSWIRGRRSAQLLAWVVGLALFIESNISILVTGSVCRPLFDRFRVSRQKLAYLVDSTCAPVCILVPFNAWGAYVLGLLAGLGVDRSVTVFAEALPLNFYALGALALAALSAGFGLDWGPMRRAERDAAEGRGGGLAPGATVPGPEATGRAAGPGGAGAEAGLEAGLEEVLGEPRAAGPMGPAGGTGSPPRALDMLLPIGVMVATMPIGMLVTGHGHLVQGSGSTSVLWAVLAGLVAAWVVSLVRGRLTADRVGEASLEGAGKLVGMAFILLLALALGQVTRVLGTGQYVAGVVVGRVPPPVLLPLLFAVSGTISFSTGSSWGTFAIMLPVAVPMATGLGAPIAPFVAAVLSGGIFGDHCSPISDTTIIASLASACDHIEHVRTQLPYALTVAGVAILGFASVGVWLML
jgi:Na+/H+ antiporter NhaC